MQLHPSWLDGLIGLASVHYEMENHELSLKYIQKAKTIFDNNQATGDIEACLFSEEQILMLLVVTTRMTGDLAGADRVYKTI